VRVDLLLTDRPITPSGTGRAAPYLSSPGTPTDGAQTQSCTHLIKVRSVTRCSRNYKGPTSQRWTFRSSTTSLVLWGGAPRHPVRASAESQC
jgi:hypothetical protein